ncbi:aminotransferase class IV [Candidatus Pelagibacter sp.]|uniref:aminotransferase class IV n=1 Tax=Candidatus Pelagibacter sp. TaxID=2024849 RepID=UPI003F84B00A
MIDFSKLKGKIYFNEKFIDNSKAKIHALNHSLHFSASVFEGIAIYDKKPLFEFDHFKRLQNSAKILKLDFKLSAKQFSKINAKLVKHNIKSNGYIRPIIFRTSHSMSPDTTYCKSSIAIACWSWGTLFNKKSITLGISKWPKLNRKIFPIEAKSSGSYQSSVISRIEAKQQGFDDCIMLDNEKYISETTACNIFWIKNNIVYTPSTDSALNGITRQAVIRILKKVKVSCKIGKFRMKDVLNADSVFLTGTAAEVQLVGKINKTDYSLNNYIFDIIKKNYDLIKSKSLKRLSSI